MEVLTVTNVNTALNAGINYLLSWGWGHSEESRNGKVLVAPGPVCTVYRRPQERVLFSPTRDANPFFHLMESLWMLAGRNDVAYPAQFNSRLSKYSDDGKTFYGAYGYRWRAAFGYDQLLEIIAELKKNPTSRRCVLSMWNGMAEFEAEDYGLKSDLRVAGAGGKDVPCNTHAYFDARGGALNMTVCNRSNDAIWGAYGANAVHFSFLQEYMADQIGVGVGEYRQFSNNLHIYTDIFDKKTLETMALEGRTLNLYDLYPDMKKIYLNSEVPGWDASLQEFICSGRTDGRHGFFRDVAEPMYAAWFARKAGAVVEALDILKEMPYCDWQVAALDWVKRREERKANNAA